MVHLLDHAPDTGTMLLERLDATRPLSSVTDDDAARQILAEFLARLVALPAPEGLRQLADIAAAMLDQVPRAVPALRDPAEQRLVYSVWTGRGNRLDARPRAGRTRCGTSKTARPHWIRPRSPSPQLCCIAQSA